MNEEKLKEISEAVQDIVLKRIEDNYLKIHTNFEKEPFRYIKGLLDSLKELFDKAKIMQNSEEKDDIAYITFTFLYSKVLQNKNGLRIDVLDKNLYLDEQEVYVFWEPTEIFVWVEEDMKYIERYLSSSFISLKKYEFLELYNSYLVNYYQILAKMLIKMVPCIQSMQSYKALKKEKEVKVLLGEYMDNYQCIYSLVGEKS